MSDSYTSSGQGILDHLRQIAFLRQFYSKHLEVRVACALSEMKLAETRIWEHYRVRLSNLDVLEIGPGQFLGQMPYLSLNNHVSAVDRDLIAQRCDVRLYMKMLRVNGAVRTLKTIGRKALGLDRRYRMELCRALGVPSLPSFQVRQATADRLCYADKSFDLVYSRAVFQHLPTPANAVSEIARVLKPRGIAYISLHPYTSPTGCLDPRVLRGGVENELGLWPHLRPELKDRVKPNAYVNKLGLHEWRHIFIAESTNPVFFVAPVNDEYFPLAAALKRAGYLQDYSVEELTAGALDVMFCNSA